MSNACFRRILISVCAATLFGILIPDFRYGTVSIVGVIVGRPLVAIVLSLWAWRVTSCHDNRRQIATGIGVLVIENLAGTGRFFFGAGSAPIDGLSAGIFIASFAVQIAIFATALFAIAMFRRGFRHRS